MTHPRYDQLPVDPAAPPRSAWGLFGPDDEVGAMNLLTPERTLLASQLVRRGAVFSLNLDLDLPSPPILGRKPLEHTVIDGPSGPDDRYDVFFPQASSQWDGLSHVRHPQYGYYNGWPAEQVIAGLDSKLGISAWGSRGLAGRFVLIDVAGYLAKQGTPLDPSITTVFGVEQLEAILEDQGVTLSPGTFLMFNFDWTTWYLSAGPETRERLARPGNFDDVGEDLVNFFPSPGIARDEAMAEWLWNNGVVAVISDAPAVESMPMHRDSPEGFLHYRLTALLGIAYGELWDLRSVTADCRIDGVYEGLMTSAPFNKRGGSGSSANALAIK